MNYANIAAACVAANYAHFIANAYRKAGGGNNNANNVLSSIFFATFVIVVLLYITVACRKGSAKEDTKQFLNYALQRLSLAQAANAGISERAT